MQFGSILIHSMAVIKRRIHSQQLNTYSSYYFCAYLPKLRSKASTADTSMMILGHFMTSYTVSSSATATSTLCRFLLDCSRPFGMSASPVTNRVFSQPSSVILLAKSFVLNPGQSKLSTTPSPCSFSLALSATRIPIWTTFRGSFVLKSRGFGPKATPPPRNIGLWPSPRRALPVPF